MVVLALLVVAVQASRLHVICSRSLLLPPGRVNVRMDLEPSPESEALGDAPDADLLNDIARFKALDSQRAEGQGGDGSPDIAMTVINGLGVILTFNFVIIVGLFVWFLVGAVAQLGFKADAPISAFRNAWDPYILPLLTTHMALTFLSKGIEKVTGKEAAGSVGGNWDIK